MCPILPNRSFAGFRFTATCLILQKRTCGTTEYGLGCPFPPESDKYAVEMADITLLVRVAPVYLNCSGCLGRYVESFVDDTPTCG